MQTRMRMGSWSDRPPLLPSSAPVPFYLSFVGNIGGKVYNPIRRGWTVGDTHPSSLPLSLSLSTFLASISGNAQHHHGDSRSYLSDLWIF